MKTAVHFIAEHQSLGKKVYVHCRAGHGRSAAVVFAWLLTKNPDVDLEELNRNFCQLRDVRKTLWKQRNILRFYSRLRKGDDDSDDHDEEPQLLSDDSDDEF
jgi:atypical dual specificity phosphatase